MIICFVICQQMFSSKRLNIMSFSNIVYDVMFQAGEKGSAFVKIWLESYKNYNEKNWSGNSVAMAHRLGQIFPHLIHVEPTSFNHPTWKMYGDLYRRNYNLSNNYAIHLYFKQMHYIPESMGELDGYNCTVGAAMRRVLYSTGRLRTDINVTVGRMLKGAKWVREKLKIQTRQSLGFNKEKNITYIFKRIINSKN